MKKHIIDEKTGIGYTLQGDYYIPNLTLPPEDDTRPITFLLHLVSISFIVFFSARICSFFVTLSSVLRFYFIRFAEILQAKTNKDILQQKKYLEESLQKAIARTADVEMLYERLYEDNVKGKVSDSSFERLSLKYETERDELKMKIKNIRVELSGIETMRQGTEQFTKAIRKFMEMETLSPVLLRELVEKIEVYSAEGQGRRKTQRIIIYYKFIGAIEIPASSSYGRLRKETRQGVEVEYITQSKSA